MGESSLKKEAERKIWRAWARIDNALLFLGSALPPIERARGIYRKTVKRLDEKQLKELHEEVNDLVDDVNELKKRANRVGAIVEEIWRTLKS